MGGVNQERKPFINNHLVILLSSTVLYLVLYFVFEVSSNASITAAALLPVMVTGFFWGLRAGLLAGFLFFGVNIMLPVLTGFMSFPEALRRGALMGGTALVLAGGFSGWMYEQRAALRKELAERKRVAEDLHRSEDRLRRITDNLHDIVCYTDTNFLIQYVNPAFYQLLGYPAEYVMGRSWFDFVCRDDLAAVQQAFQRVLQEKITIRLEYRCQTMNGDTIWLETICNLLMETGGSVQLIFTARDVAERRQQVSALREDNATVRALLNSPSDLAILVDRSGTILELNAAAEKRFGGDAQKIIGRNLLDFSFVMDASTETQRLQALDVIGTRTPVHIELKNGDSSYEISVYPVIGPDTTVERLAVFGRDVTSYKNAEQAEHEQRLLAEALANTADVLSSSLDLNEVLDQILANIENVVPYEAVEVMLLEDERVRVVRYRSIYGHPLVQALEHGVPLEDLKILNEVVASRSSVLIGDTTADPNWVTYPETGWVGSYISTPIQMQGQIVGFLNAFSSKPGFYRKIQAHRLHSFADQAAIALQNARLYAASERKAQQMALLNEITRSAIHAPDMNSLLATLIQRLGTLFDNNDVFITLWNEAEQKIVPAAAPPELNDVFVRTAISAEQLNFGALLLQSGRVLTMEDLQKSPYAHPELAERLPECALLGIPLIADQQKLGTVLIGYPEARVFTEDEIALAELLGGQIALAISKAILLESEQQQRIQLSRANMLITSLGQAAARIEAGANVDEILIAIGAELKQLGLYCLVALRQNPQEDMKFRYTSFDSPGIAAAEKLSGISLRGYSFTSDNFPPYNTLLEQCKPIFVPNLKELLYQLIKYAPAYMRDLIIKSIGMDTSNACILLPLVVNENVIGFLGLWGGSLSADDAPALALFSNQLATALEKGRLHEEIRRLSITDDLTSVYNRRGLYTFGEHGVERAQRFNHPMSILMLDIDLFKQTNDTLGHLVGDQLLRAVADCCRKNVREVDIVGRYGGDEFVILLTESDRKNALQVAERLRKSIMKLSIQTDHTNIGMTVSCGVTVLGQDTPDLEALIAKADKALYLAKSQGRNQVFYLEAESSGLGESQNKN